jgi:hypothetical protein
MFYTLTSFNNAFDQSHCRLTKTYCLTKYRWLIWHLNLREGTPENILAFKVALKLKTAFNRKNTLRVWIRHVGGRAVSKPLPSLLQVTWPVLAPCTVLHIHTNIFIQQFNFIALIPSHYSVSKIALNDSSITLYEPRKRHFYLLNK